MSNEHNLEKVTSSDFSAGGTLEPEQFEQFMIDVQEEAEFLSQVRQVPVSAPSGNFPRLDVGERQLRAVAEGSAAAEANISQPSVPYETTKAGMSTEWTWESINETIGSVEEQARQLFVQRFAADLEELGSAGDTSSADPFESINDGWIVDAQGQGSPTYAHDDAGTPQPINNALFHQMSTTIPNRYSNNANLKFLISSNQEQAYKDFLTDRTTSAGDAMLLSSQEPTPYGYDIETPLGWPDDTAMLVDTRNLAYVVSSDLRIKQTRSSERNVTNDIELIMSMFAKIDYKIVEAQGAVVGTGIAAP